MLCPNMNMSKSECVLKDSKAAFTVFMAEVIATYVLVSVILGVKYYHTGPAEFKYFLIGMTLMGLIIAIKQISGAAINPAVGLV